MFVCERALKSFYLAPHDVPGIKYKICAMIGLLKKTLFDWLIRLEGNWNAIPLSSTLSPLGAQNKDLSTASQALLARVIVYIHDTG